MHNIPNNNNVVLTGSIVTVYSYSHKTFGEKFFLFTLKADRLGGNSDLIRVIVSERIVDVSEDMTGKYITVTGQLRSFNSRHSDGKNHLLLFVFAKEINFYTPTEAPIFDENKISLDGYICKPVIFRTTPSGRYISDLVLAVNRPYTQKTDYVPCILWGRNASFAEKLPVGTRIEIEGRIQSRDYQKRISEEDFETRTAYEVSASRVEVVEDSNNE